MLQAVPERYPGNVNRLYKLALSLPFETSGNLPGKTVCLRYQVRAS